MGGDFSVLQVGEFQDHVVEGLRKRFVLLEAPLAANLGAIRAIATTGKVEIGRQMISRLPRLEIISCLGAGCEGVDLEAAAERDIEVTTTSRVLAADVADIAMGLILTMARDLAGADRFVRAGHWTAGRYPLGTTLGGAWLGIVGLGNIGSALARRAEAFDMKIAYHTRSPRRELSWHHMADLTAMARQCRFLALCCPGGPATHRLVSADILRALGPDGYLINVARGSVVDEAALVEALETGGIAAAGLDVFQDEPRPHPGLIASPRAVLLPHIGSATLETRQRMAVAMIEAIERRAAR
ncbi:MAG TPA: 2-hydroxyacid dehydrogenase [Shinella sp.]|jgi:lactate dehydrogenase-like 2-hydroxyacid dehydrogenase|uniref:2-hydroxyacid dehydrogenase n=1 Tax=Shinella sp. TaxID=1870904 RepID=UPI002E0DE53D|nr:2-hydroxyacid dehydrogenase [Shinella sp.]